MRYVYMCIDKKDNGLPIAIADSPKELSEIVGVCASTISTQIWLNENRGKETKYVRVRLDND